MSSSKSFAFVVFAFILGLVAVKVQAAPQPDAARLVERGLNDPDNKGSATWFYPGLGACEWNNTEDEFVAALSPADFGPAWPPRDSPACGACISFTAPDAPTKPAVVVKVVDKCPSCKAGDLNLSPAAFKQFFPLDKGRYRVVWNKVACPASKA